MEEKLDWQQFLYDFCFCSFISTYVSYIEITTPLLLQVANHSANLQPVVQAKSIRARSCHPVQNLRIADQLTSLEANNRNITVQESSCSGIYYFGDGITYGSFGPYSQSR